VSTITTETVITIAVTASLTAVAEPASASTPIPAITGSAGKPPLPQPSQCRPLHLVMLQTSISVVLQLCYHVSKASQQGRYEHVTSKTVQLPANVFTELTALKIRVANSTGEIPVNGPIIAFALKCAGEHFDELIAALSGAEGNDSE
jgi:hypothetical protein